MELTKAETKVIMVIWETDHDMALPEILEKVNSRYQKDWKPQTVSTFLTRLVKKGFLNMYRQGRSFLYHPCFSQDQVLRGILMEMASVWFRGDCQLLLRKAETFLLGGGPLQDEAGSEEGK